MSLNIILLTSGFIGFGSALLIEMAIRARLKSKWQKILAGMTLPVMGYGLMQLTSLVLAQAFRADDYIDTDKIIYRIVAALLATILLTVTLYILSGKQKSIATPVAPPQFDSSWTGKRRKIAFAILTIGALAVAFQWVTNPVVYYFFEPSNAKNCESPSNRQPSFTMEFKINKDRNYVFVNLGYFEGGEKKQTLYRLEKCSVFDAENWTCGGGLNELGNYEPRTGLVNGVLTVRDDERTLDGCRFRIERR